MLVAWVTESPECALSEMMEARLVAWVTGSQVQETEDTQKLTPSFY